MCRLRFCHRNTPRGIQRRPRRRQPLAMTTSLVARGDANRSLINRHSSGIRLRLSAATAYDARITHTQTPHPAHAPASETPSLPTRRRSPVCTVSRSVAHFLHTRISRQRCPLPLSRSAAQPLGCSSPPHTHASHASVVLDIAPTFCTQAQPMTHECVQPRDR